MLKQGTQIKLNLPNLRRLMWLCSPVGSPSGMNHYRLIELMELIAFKKGCWYDRPFGQQLGNYRLIRLLGQGGFADTYLGEHTYLKTFAAIKVLRAQLAQAAELLIASLCIW